MEGSAAGQNLVSFIRGTRRLGAQPEPGQPEMNAFPTGASSDSTIHIEQHHIAVRQSGHNGDSLPMNPTSRFPDSGENDLPRELVDLAKAISVLPEEYQTDLEPVYSRVVDSVKRRRRILALVQEALAQLRLDIKYLMFDLEVTRKERDELRERLD